MRLPRPHKSMLSERRAGVEGKIKKLGDGVIKLESTAEGVSALEEEIKIKVRIVARGRPRLHAVT